MAPVFMSKFYWYLVSMSIYRQATIKPKSTKERADSPPCIAAFFYHFVPKPYWPRLPKSWRGEEESPPKHNQLAWQKLLLAKAIELNCLERF